MNTLNKILFFYLTGLVLQAATTSLSAQGLLEDHTDITFLYETGTGTWSAELQHGGTFDNPDTSTPTDEAAMPAEDQPFNTGDRYEQPTSPSFDFTGIPDGDPLWILPQTDRGYTWPGFRSDQSPGTFQAFNPGDPRVTSTPQRWVTIRLVSVNYIGQSPGVNLSAWQFQGGPIVWMTTADGIGSTDLFYLQENAHTHLNWGFSALGIYRVGFTAEAILQSTGLPVTSGIHTVTFAIGTLATWQSSYYSGPELEDTNISGLTSDSDSDNVELILEYAFNMVPTTSDYHQLTPGTGTSGLPVARIHSSGGQDYLQIEFIRRKSETNPQITYIPEFNGTLDSAGWTEASPTPGSSIDSTWERVVVTDTQPVSPNSARFARVGIQIQETITYVPVAP